MPERDQPHSGHLVADVPNTSLVGDASTSGEVHRRQSHIWADREGDQRASRPANPALRLGRYRVAPVNPSRASTGSHETRWQNQCGVTDAARASLDATHFASLLFQGGALITYVSRELGHKNPSITPRV